MTPASKVTLAEALASLDEQVSESRQSAQRRRLVAAVSSRGVSGRLVFFVATGTLAAAALALFIFSPRPEPRAAGSQSTKAILLVPAVNSKEAERPAALAVGEPVVEDIQHLELARGLSMAVHAGARVGSRRLGRARFQVTLEDGQVELVAAAPRGARASWVVLAGAYRVEARDAVVSVRYAASTQDLRVSVSEGSARVFGPHGVSQELGPGQGFSQTDPGEPTSRAVRPKAALRSSSVPRREEKPEAWRSLYRRGRYLDAVARARQDGLVVSKGLGLDASALRDLADAARLAHANDEAHTLLTALRQRYPNSGPASDAAFLLGRLAGTSVGSAKDAEHWFLTYLRESPSGTYAQEALGRLLTLPSRDPTGNAKHELARRYLAEFPGGPYAALARNLSR